MIISEFPGGYTSRTVNADQNVLHAIALSADMRDAAGRLADWLRDHVPRHAKLLDTGRISEDDECDVFMMTFEEEPEARG